MLLSLVHFVISIMNYEMRNNTIQVLKARTRERVFKLYGDCPGSVSMPTLGKVLAGNGVTAASAAVKGGVV